MTRSMRRPGDRDRLDERIDHRGEPVGVAASSGVMSLEGDAGLGPVGDLPDQIGDDGVDTAHVFQLRDAEDLGGRPTMPHGTGWPAATGSRDGGLSASWTSCGAAAGWRRWAWAGRRRRDPLSGSGLRDADGAEAATCRPGRPACPSTVGHRLGVGGRDAAAAGRQPLAHRRFFGSFSFSHTSIGRGDEDRGVRPGDQADEQCQRELLEGHRTEDPRPDDQQRDDRQQRA